MAKDLRTYLDQLVSTHPEALKVVEDEVDPVSRRPRSSTR